jgi:hypothetical protein
MPIRASLMLADAAQAVGGKLYILGGGWNLIGPAPTPSAIAIYVEVPWDLTNTPHRWKLTLLDSDGEPVMVGTPIGEQPMILEGGFEVGRPPGLRPGTALGAPLAINLGPLPLPHNSSFAWIFSIDGRTNENWRLPFGTRPAPEQPPEQVQLPEEQQPD